MKKRKAIIDLWILALSAVFITTLMYIVLTPIVKDNLIPIADDLIENNDSQEVVDTMETIWDLWPWMIFISAIILMIVSVQTREPDVRRF